MEAVIVVFVFFGFFFFEEVRHYRQQPERIYCMFSGSEERLVISFQY